MGAFTANGLYSAGRENFLSGDIDWPANNIRVVLVDTNDDTPDQTADQDLADRLAGSRVATSGNLSSKTTTNGVADAADTTFSSVTGDQSEALDLYKATGTDSTSLLIANINSATGLPVTPNGGDIQVQWDSGANRIFKL